MVMRSRILVLIITQLGSVLFGFHCPQSDIPGTLMYEYTHRNGNSGKSSGPDLSPEEIAAIAAGVTAGVAVLGGVVVGSMGEPARPQPKKRKQVIAPVSRKQIASQRNAPTKDRSVTRRASSVQSQVKAHATLTKKTPNKKRATRNAVRASSAVAPRSRKG